MTRGRNISRPEAPERTCIVTGNTGPTDAMVRFVVGPDGSVVPDILGKLPGRGMWVAAQRDVVERAGKGAFSRSAKAQVTVPDGLAVVKVKGTDQVRLTWDPSPDPCNDGYQVYAAPTARPLIAPSFPDDPPFADITDTDADGSPTDTSFTGQALGSGLTVFLVIDVGTSGEPGPAGHY